MKRFFNSMAGRVFVILFGGILLATALTSWLADQERQRAFVQFRETRLLDQAELFVVTLDAIPVEGRPAFLNTSQRFGLHAKLLPGMPFPKTKEMVSGASLRKLRARLEKEFPVIALTLPQWDCRVHMGQGRDRQAARHGVCEGLIVQLQDGSAVQLVVPPLRPYTPPPRLESPWYLAPFLVIIGLLAWIVSSMATRPLKRLAQAAESLGQDIDRPPLQVQGATEIRQAATAFNAMQARLRDHIQQRTHMLAAITHDLQTPLTRLRLRLEKVKDETLRDRLIEDLAHTQAIVREGLDLARSMDTSEPLQLLDIDSLLDTVCTDAADAGQQVTLEGQVKASVMARPAALRRCLTNLIDNAVKYGQEATVKVQHEERGSQSWIAISIRDRGPGIPPEQFTQVFEPFYRLESSRSRETGGTGLGLTIARNVALQHDGEIRLRNHPQGGLEATLLLPCAKAGAATAHSAA